MNTMRGILGKTVFCLLPGALSCLGLCVRADDPHVLFTGAQSVDTGYYVTENTAVVVDFQLTDVTTAQQCVWSAGGNLGHRFYVTGELDWGWASHKSYSDGHISTGLKVDANRIVATVDGFNKVVTIVKNEDIVYEYKTQWANPIPENTTSDNTLKIGSRYAEGKFYASMKLFGFKIYESGELVRDYVPAMRDGVAGLYDKENGGFIYDTRLPAQSSYELMPNGELYTVNDGYLESIAGSGLNARMVIGDNIRAEVDFAYTDTTSQQRVFGWNSRPSFYISSSGNFTVSIRGADGIYGEIQADTKRHTAVIDYAQKVLEIRTGGAVSWKKSFNDDIAADVGKPTPVALFANTENDTYTGLKFKHPARVKIYRAKFYRGDELVHDYRPCMKGDIPGMRDRVDGTFVCGENIEAFRVGGDVERIPDDGYVELTGNNQESGAAKWFDTGYLPNPNTHIEFDYALADNYSGNSAGNTGEWWYLSAYTPPAGVAPAERLNFAGNGANTFRWRSGSDDWAVANTEVAAPTAQRGIRRRIVYDPVARTYSLVTAGYTNFTVAASTSITRMFERTMRIGANTDNPPKAYAPLRIYGLKIYESGILKHDFVPAVTNGVPMLLDAVTGEFKADSQLKPVVLGCGGTITSDAPSRDAHLEFTGEQSIDTGFCPTPNTAVVADFQFTSAINNPQQFVWSSSNDLCLRLYTPFSPSCLAWMCHNGDQGGNFAEDVPLDLFRLTASIDGHRRTAEFVRDGESIYTFTGTWKANDNHSACTMRIGSRFAEGDNGWNFTSMKLYSFKIYDAGVLVRDYVPFVQEGVAGLYDRANGTFCTDDIGTKPMKAGGIGSMISPLADTRLKRGKAKTFDGRSAAAVGYQWYVNGVAAAGETNAFYTVEWRQGAADTVSVVPYFDVFGVRTAGETVSARVTYASEGFLITVF